jgi:hypothetical protein
VRWHFHPEYEIHHVVATSGHFFVGDFIGTFEPGNLVLTGPNLPHNWVSDVPEGTVVPLRCRVVQFSESFIPDARSLLPELSACEEILDLSRRGVLFSPDSSQIVSLGGVRYRGCVGSCMQDVGPHEGQPQQQRQAPPFAPNVFCSRSSRRLHARPPDSLA